MTKNTRTVKYLRVGTVRVELDNIYIVGYGLVGGGLMYAILYFALFWGAAIGKAHFA